MLLRKYLITAKMSAQKQMNAGVFYLLPNYLLKVVYLIPLIYLWKILMNSGVETSMTLNQMLTYTYMSTLLSGLLIIKTPIGNLIFEGLITSLYQRPLSIFGHIIMQTLGENATTLLFFSLPMMMISPLIGISIMPETWLFLISLILCISLGFAIEFIFASVVIHMINTQWAVYVIHASILLLFSGNVFPFAMLPWGLDKVMIYQPFGSLGGAVLSIYTGISDPTKILFIQLVWNIIFWFIAIVTFNKSQERMVSQGG